MDLTPVEKYFTGKALATVRGYVALQLAEAEKLGYWPKGASRSVKAALNKQAVAQKFARANDRDRNHRVDDPEGLLDDVCDTRPEWFRAKRSGSSLVHAMMFGQVERAPEMAALAAQLVSHARTGSERQALAYAAQWAADWTPVADLVKLLDGRRPVPKMVFKTLSGTVVQNLSVALGVALKTIQAPPMKQSWMKVKKVIDGVEREVEVEVSYVEILWPEGTVHCASRFASGSRAGNAQCEACGHAIRDPWNWAPLLAQGIWQGQDRPLSLWVGRDCARKLFGCEVTGDAIYQGRQAAVPNYPRATP